jgi:hypothetical protein
MKIRIFQHLMFSAFIIAVLSCTKNNEADIINYSIAGQESSVEINATNHTVNITFPVTLTSAKSLIAEFLLSEGAQATINGINQVSGQTTNNFEQTFSYLIQAENKKTQVEWQVLSTNIPGMLSWGLGRFQSARGSNNKDYEWYLDQKQTGTFSSVNCGPTSTTMVAKWSDPSFTKTPVDARAAYRPAGGWWYTSDIDKYLTDNSIPHYFINLSSNSEGTRQIITTTLNEGEIVILCLDMYYIRSEASTSQRVDKFYATSSSGWGHFIVVKGHKAVDSKYFFEAYDPYSFGVIYSDGVLKGRNRYYRSDDIFQATSVWWNYAIVITPKGLGKAAVAGLDPATIPHNRGR